MKKALIRWMCLALVVLSAVSLCACGTKAPEPTPTPEPTPEATPSPEPTPEPTPMPTVQSVDIQYSGKKLDDFTMHIGEIVPLTVAVLPADLPVEVEWSTDPDGEAALKFHPSDTDPAQCDVECIGPLPENSGGVRIYAQVYGGKASCMVHVIGTGVAREEQKVEIYYPIEDRVLTNFSMRVGETIDLEARPLNGAAKEGTVVWSMSDKAATALRFVEDKTDPWKVTLECFKTIPTSVNIYVELDGVKSACVIYPN